MSLAFKSNAVEILNYHTAAPGVEGWVLGNRQHSAAKPQQAACHGHPGHARARAGRPWHESLKNSVDLVASQPSQDNILNLRTW
jgi:hypothetical protein